jgi:hypothetical protein
MFGDGQRRQECKNQRKTRYEARRKISCGASVGQNVVNERMGGKELSYDTS